MLKPLIYTILGFILAAILFILFINKIGVNALNKDKEILAVSDSTSGDSLPEFIMLPDSSLIPYDSVEWGEPLDYVVFPYNDDTLFTDTFQLKNNYQLILFPAADGYSKNGRICYGHYARLIGDSIDEVILSSYGTEPSKYWLRYDSIDFDNSFAIEYSGGGNYALYINLFDKTTGELMLAGHAGTHDVKNGLIIYLDDEDEEGNVFLYDVKKDKKIKIETPDNVCFASMGYWTGYTITKVTPSMIYLSYDYCDKPLKLKVKR